VGANGIGRAIMNEEKKAEVARSFEALREVKRDCARRVAQAEQGFHDTLKKNCVVELTVKINMPPDTGSSYDTWTFRTEPAEGCGMRETCDPGQPGYESLYRLSVVGMNGPADFMNAACEFLVAKKMLVEGEPVVSLNDKVYFFNEASGQYEAVE